MTCAGARGRIRRGEDCLPSIAHGVGGGERAREECSRGGVILVRGRLHHTTTILFRAWNVSTIRSEVPAGYWDVLTGTRRAGVGALTTTAPNY